MRRQAAQASFETVEKGHGVSAVRIPFSQLSQLCKLDLTSRELAIFPSSHSAVSCWISGTQSVRHCICHWQLSASDGFSSFFFFHPFLSCFDTLVYSPVFIIRTTKTHTTNARPTRPAPWRAPGSTVSSNPESRELDAPHTPWPLETTGPLSSPVPTWATRPGGATFPAPRSPSPSPSRPLNPTTRRPRRR